MPDLNTLRYRINERDEITFVNQAWTAFAESNQAAEALSGSVVGQSLWLFISDRATRSLYKQIIARVRAGHAVQFNLRCDSPGCRRLLHMSITLADDGTVEFRTHEIEHAERPNVRLLSAGGERTDEFIRECAWCNRFDVGDNTWLEVEAATSHLHLFDDGELPRVSHGICGECFDRMSRMIGEPEETYL